MVLVELSNEFDSDFGACVVGPLVVLDPNRLLDSTEVG